MSSTRNRLHGTHLAFRYVAAGAANTLLYVGLTLLLAGPLGLPIQIAIPIGFTTALATHFLMQRLFVFGHVEEFALRQHEQAGLYVAIGLTQYAVTAAVVALVPAWTGAGEKPVYVVTVGCISVVTFLLLRSRVFHPR